jgi:hypothetical protein
LRRGERHGIVPLWGIDGGDGGFLLVYRDGKRAELAVAPLTQSGLSISKRSRTFSCALAVVVAALSLVAVPAIAQPAGAATTPPTPAPRGLRAPFPSNVARPRLATNLALDTPSPPQTYSYWTFPSTPAGGYRRLYQVVSPMNDPVASAGQATQAYFYAMQWYNTGAPSYGGYMGLQSDSQGKRAIFSWFGGINGHGPGISQAFSGEGVGWQTMISYNWQAGRTYRLNVAYSSTTSTGYWYTATIVDTQANKTSTIGTIEFPQSFGGLQQYVNNFVEWYGATLPTCSGYPWSNVTFSAPSGRGPSGSPTIASAPGSPPSGTPDGPACSGVTNNLSSMNHVNGTR